MNVDQSAAKRTDLAGERTDLAAERTMLAWWRTALASLAVALAVGRLLPELSDLEPSWPYVILGLGFAVYATGLFAYGSRRGRRPASVGRLLAGGFGTLLALATIALIAAQ